MFSGQISWVEERKWEFRYHVVIIVTIFSLVLSRIKVEIFLLLVREMANQYFPRILNFFNNYCLVNYDLSFCLLLLFD